MGQWFITFIALLVIQTGIHAETDTSKITVATPLGLVEGYVVNTINSNPFYKFEGVPFAKPPIGKLRFEDPQDVEPWNETLKANSMIKCMQYDHFQQEIDKTYVVHGNEDCLYVNIYTHTTNLSANLDVLVHIHGGAFMFGGGGSYGPYIIMDRNIVFVTFNYRLGPLGFATTEDDILPGNVGLKDQTKALKWIKENIKYFGGNPDTITIHGLSAGGASVHLHYMLPASRGLFIHGISQSGCALNPWVLAENVKEKTAKVASLLGCPTSNSKEIKTCLKSKPAREIVRATRVFQPFLYNPFSPFGVVVDGKWASNPVLPEHPYMLLKKGKILDLPWIVSYTHDEGLYPAADFWADKQHLIDIDTKWNEIMPFILHYNESAPSDLKDEISQRIREHYLGSKQVNRQTYSTLVEIVSDRLFKADIETSARLQNAVVRSDIYCYTFTYRGRVSKSTARAKSVVNLGVSHGDDTIYVFSTKFDTNSTEKDREMSKTLIDMITSFMKEGKPNITTKWQPLIKRHSGLLSQLNIAGPEDYEMEHVNEIGNREFWNRLPLAENHNINEFSNHEEF
uniref:Carboxylic ester hydrolase n=1 Tax=Dendroctonus ponderosae TaxID=77166 RepID=A0AAR5QIG4_DENPD